MVRGMSEVESAIGEWRLWFSLAELKRTRLEGRWE